MNKYFEMRENGELLYGVVENIPENVTHEKVVERIESKDDHCSIIVKVGIIPEKDIDIRMDWLSIDIQIDKNFNDVSNSLMNSIENGTENEVVYTALKNMKQNPNLSISEAILLSVDEIK